jgi:hypothetical protein
MIEIYLATLLFGLGTMYNKAQQHVPLKNPNNNSDQDTNPYKQKIMKKVNKAEKKLGKKLNKKCKTILPRSFSNLLDEETSKLLNENEEVLKYVPKSNNKIKSSLTGEEVELDQFITSQTIGRDNSNNISSNTWAIPYFKGTATQNMNLDGYKNKLDIHTGRSEFDFHKKETKNFFKPNKDISFVNGVPNMLDKLEDRYIKSNNRNTELPFEQIKVARGVGQSYGNKGKGGFHQFEINDLAKPKNVDELRSICNPKKTYSEPIQTGKSNIDKRSSIAKIFKNRPEKVFHKSKEEWGPKKSVHTKDTYRSKIQQNPKKIVHNEYSGNANPVKVNPSKRPSVKKDTNNRYKEYKNDIKFKKGGWTIKNNNNREPFQSEVKVDNNYDISNYGKDSIKLPPNERDTTQNKTIASNVVSAIKSIIAPLQDKMKRTKKENIEGNPNIKGYMGINIPKKQTMYDPNDVARTTIKETTEDNNHNGNMNSVVNNLTIYDPNDVARTTIKETTENNKHKGNMNSVVNNLTIYDPNDIARTTIKETTEVNKNETQIKGATKLTVYDPNDVARTTIKETTIHNNHNGNISVERKKTSDYNYASAKATMKETTIYNIHNSNISYNKGEGYLIAKPFAPETEKQNHKSYNGNINSGVHNTGPRDSNDYYAPPTEKQNHKSYTGSANASAKQHRSRAAESNAELNQKILVTREPTQTGVKVMASTTEQGGVSYNKQNSNYDGSDHSNTSITNGGTFSSNDIGNNDTKPRISLSNNSLQDRYDPRTGAIKQLKDNPLAISINTPINHVERFSDTDTDSYFGDLML